MKTSRPNHSTVPKGTRLIERVEFDVNERARQTRVCLHVCVRSSGCARACRAGRSMVPWRTSIAAVVDFVCEIVIR